MTLEERVIILGNEIAADVKALKLSVGDKSTLSTTEKSNLVAAINEIHSQLGGAGVTIDDSATNGDNSVAWSADKIFDTIETAKQTIKDDLTGGANTALDTFKELQDALNNDPTFAATMATSLSNKVDYSIAQALTQAQKLQVCENIGVGNPDADFLTEYITIRDA